MTIEPATPADLFSILAMGREFLASRPSVPANIEAMEGLARDMMARPDGIVLVGRVDGVALGMLGAVAYPDPYSWVRTASELFWWVAPPARGVKSAVTWLRAYHAWAESRGAELVRMVSLASDGSVGALYTRLGYVPVETHYQARLSDLPEYLRRAA